MKTISWNSKKKSITKCEVVINTIVWGSFKLLYVRTVKFEPKISGSSMTFCQSKLLNLEFVLCHPSWNFFWVPLGILHQKIGTRKDEIDHQFDGHHFWLYKKKKLKYCIEKKISRLIHIKCTKSNIFFIELYECKGWELISSSILICFINSRKLEKLLGESNLSSPNCNKTWRNTYNSVGS